jgi:hypothetical protein
MAFGRKGAMQDCDLSARWSAIRQRAGNENCPARFVLRMRFDLIAQPPLLVAAKAINSTTQPPRYSGSIFAFVAEEILACFFFVFLGRLVSLLIQTEQTNGDGRRLRMLTSSSRSGCRPCRRRPGFHRPCPSRSCSLSCRRRNGLTNWGTARPACRRPPDGGFRSVRP